MPAILEPNALYDDTAIYAELGISAAALTAARREGKLRFTRKGNRILYLGEWVMQWLTDDAARVET